eukprot:GHVP01034798.1.p1 GENE.GHVP01034798.1~~GHVP01034798.1.p1  ORF type:complete len:228 (+),score=2.73 GHVP01034798.1:547-1230(+)
MGPRALEAYKEWISTMESLDKIGPCHEKEGYTGPTVVMPKANGGWRITHDYSGLKPFTPLYSFQQSKIEEIWQWATKQSYLTKVDAIKAFHAVPINAEDCKFYKFNTPYGIYSYKVLPMGTRNSPALFAEYITKILEPIRQRYVNKIFNYQDDIMISGTTLDETREREEKITKLVLQRMKEARLQLVFLSFVNICCWVSSLSFAVASCRTWPLLYWCDLSPHALNTH